VVLAREDVITAADLPANLRPSGEEDPDPGRPGLTLREAENEIIRIVLKRAGGNKTRAAKELGISRQTLINKLKNPGEKM
jgi:transcriptional regulator with PAS, ATPase and Fis domain